MVFGVDGIVDFVVSKRLALHVGGEEIAVAVLDIASHVARDGGEQAQAPVIFVEDIQQECVEFGRDRTSDESLALVEMIFRDMIGIPEQSGSEQCRERHIVMDERNAFDAVDGEILRLTEGQAANNRLFSDSVDVFVKLEFMRHLARLHLITPHFCMVLDDWEVIRIAQRREIVLGGDVARWRLDDEFVGLARLTLERLFRDKSHAVTVGFLFNIRNRVVAAKHKNAVDFRHSILIVTPLMDW